MPPRPRPGHGRTRFRARPTSRPHLCVSLRHPLAPSYSPATLRCHLSNICKQKMVSVVSGSKTNGARPGAHVRVCERIVQLERMLQHIRAYAYTADRCVDDDKNSCNNLVVSALIDNIFHAKQS